MNSIERRKRLHAYIADIDDKKVEAMLTLLEEETKYKVKFSLTEKEKQEVRQREQNRIKGNSKTYTLTQAKKMLRYKKH